MEFNDKIMEMEKGWFLKTEGNVKLKLDYFYLHGDKSILSICDGIDWKKERDGEIIECIARFGSLHVILDPI
jgi:hypothetical protein